MRIATHLIFFPVKAESLYFSTKLRVLLFNKKRALRLRKTRVSISKKLQFCQKSKKRAKNARFTFWRPDVTRNGKRAFFLPMTNRVCPKSAF